MDDPHSRTDANDPLTVLEALYDALIRRGETAGFVPALMPAGLDDGMLSAIAVDGKTLRGSVDGFHDQKAAHLLSAFAQE